MRILRSGPRFQAAAKCLGWQHFADDVLDRAAARERPHGDSARWSRAVEKLPKKIAGWSIERGAVRIRKTDNDSERRPADPDFDRVIREALSQLRPWRKGPWDFFAVDVDAEWRSDWKWERLRTALPAVPGRVLDVGGGNGYYAFRMIDCGGDAVLNIDPTALFQYQFEAAMRPLRDEPPIFTLPLADEDLPDSTKGFDLATSMGVLSHRRWPLAHLRLLRHVVRPGGLVLVETLVVPDDDDRVWTPPGRYAAMRNVWHLPSVARLRRWMAAAGFRDIEVIDVSETDTREQRSTEWMTFHSLRDFLDPADPSRTREGHPRPLRAMLRGQR